MPPHDTDATENPQQDEQGQDVERKGRRREAQVRESDTDTG